MDISLLPAISAVICFICVYMSLKAITNKMQYESDAMDLKREANELKANYKKRLKAARLGNKASTGSEAEEGEAVDMVEEVEVVNETADDGVLLV